jgi:L-lactate utilization protein LutC
MSRDHILHKVRTAIDRSAGQQPAEPPPVLLKVPVVGVPERLERFCAALEKLSGKGQVASSREEARGMVEEIIQGKSAVASNAGFLRECGVASLPGVFTGYTDAADLREACATADVGITSADYALADTGSLVMIASPEEARLVSLLPPVHVAVVPKERLLTGLDELLTIVPDPAEVTSSMVIITGPSRTADIEQILVKGVHGPGMVHAIFV